MEDLILESMNTKVTPIQQTLFSLEELTVSTVKSSESIQKDLREVKAMLKETYARNETFVMQEENVKEVKRVLTITKEQIDSTPEQTALLQKAKDLQAELKEKQNATSDYALQYALMAGKDEIVKDGVTYEIVKSAKLIKRLQ